MGARPLPLPLWDRRAGKLVYEFMDDAPSTYESQPRRSLNQWLESHPLYDWILAAYQNSRLSARKIAPFVRKHKINMDEFEPVAYRSYAEFFERRFRPGVRPFPSEPASMGAFAEARYLAWERLDQTQRVSNKRPFARRRAYSRQRVARPRLRGRSRHSRPAFADGLPPRPLLG
jgi:phosphatidylserine decarboxylase